MIVRVVGVDHVDVLGPHRQPEPRHVPGERQRRKRDRRLRPEGIEAGFPRLGLEAIPGNHAEERAMTAPPEAVEKPKDRIRAPGPPPVRDEVQHGERSPGGRLHQ